MGFMVASLIRTELTSGLHFLSNMHRNILQLTGCGRQVHVSAIDGHPLQPWPMKICTFCKSR